MPKATQAESNAASRNGSDSPGARTKATSGPRPAFRHFSRPIRIISTDRSTPATAAASPFCRKISSAMSAVPVARSRCRPPEAGCISATAARRHRRSIPADRRRFRRSYFGAIRENISPMARFLSFSRYKRSPDAWQVMEKYTP